MSTYRCPCCGHELASSLEGSDVRLFCTNGPTCACYAMNDGEVGATAQEAFEKLQIQHEGWLDSQPKE